ncbi:MAG: hypothetical protein HN368_07770, partial [Spirochaetales bacterium]|nr:hypothetical protein [Spirochaetales bacterium]
SINKETQRLEQSQADRPDKLKLSEEELTKIATDNIISRTVLVHEGRSSYPDIPDKDIDKKTKELQKQYGPTVNLEPFREQIVDEIRVDRLIKDAYSEAGSPTDEESKKLYDEDPDAWAKPEQVHCSHIVRHIFGGADEGQSLKQIMEAQRLLASGKPFEEVSKQFSDQFGQAGDLGTFSRGHMVDSFENVVFRMKPGEISEVFRTEFGYHIVLLHEKISARERSYSDARKDIFEALRTEKRDKAVEKLVTNLIEAAEIECDGEAAT